MERLKLNASAALKATVEKGFQRDIGNMRKLHLLASNA
jgi:hypothetical protein